MAVGEKAALIGHLICLGSVIAAAAVQLRAHRHRGWGGMVVPFHNMLQIYHYYHCANTSSFPSPKEQLPNSPDLFKCAQCEH